MALTRDFKQTIAERLQRDPDFARALLDEAATLFLNGEPDTARVILRDLVNATIGFEALATATAKPAKSLHRTRSKRRKRRTGLPHVGVAIFGAERGLIWTSLNKYGVGDFGVVEWPG